MKSAAFSLYKFKYPLPMPLSIASFTWTHLESIFVKLHYENYFGIGEAAPFAGMTGETVDSVLAELKGFQNFVFDPDMASEQFYQQIKARTESRHALAALDAAFHDLKGKLNHKPVYQLFAEKKKLVLNSLTIPMLNLQQTQAFATDILQKFPDVKLIKIKIDDAKVDIDIAKAIKAIFPADVGYVIDPNQGFLGAREAIEVLKEMQTILGQVIAIEQPVAKENKEGLKEIKMGLKNIPVYADESVVTMHDLESLIQTDAVNGVNIKIQKAGGIWHARQMADRAHQAGLSVMVGCMMETSIGTAAGLHFAVSTPNVSFTDIDSDLFLFQDLKSPLFTQSPFKDGIRQPFEKPGLGIDLHEKTLHTAAAQHNIEFEAITLL